MTLNWGNAV